MLQIKTCIYILVILIILYIATIPRKVCIVEYIKNAPRKVLKKLEDFRDSVWLNTYTNFPFWNTQLGSTRNMSYDIRGDVPIGHSYVGPWLQSSTRPIYNKPLWVVS